VLAEIAVEPEQPQPLEIHTLPPQEVQREDAGLCRVAASHRQGLAGEVGERADLGIAAHDQLGVEIAVAVPHAERERASSAALAHAHVAERSVPGDVHVSREQLLDLPLVVGEEREVEVDACVAKVVPDAFPDGDHLGVVRDRAQQDGLSHRSS
jgi:hypothetical protein